MAKRKRGQAASRPEITCLHGESPCRQTELALNLEKLADRFGVECSSLADDLRISAKILRRRAERYGDHVCRSCGRAVFFPSTDEVAGELLWASPCLCACCSKAPQPDLSEAKRKALEDERYRLMNAFGLGLFEDGRTRDRVAAIDAELGEAAP